ncbi:tRNA lysidine(34) synthetase TilS [Brevundimonas sp.]|uniref:tRNA lysidine(34) synthetase TilS n=1 Tax=Brevundimonas sp. TaxID=1871086 RepID=UPI0025C620AB|nr:tRNA lysidine(34) synthetase TilS [Brevundimonas sp.]
MPGGAPAESRLTDSAPDWRAAAGAVLDARLEPRVDRPVVLGLSGGGDSMALLRLAADWARRRDRPLLALTVDHGLHPDSARWTAFAGEAARAAGADWRPLRWTGPRPAAGLPAAARAARHRLLADAARAAGGRVILLAHTADDVREGEAMRDAGSTLGRLREWAPSPVWPEGRGLMLLRPLLAVGRGALRAWLEAAGIGWLEDPANADLRFARARARRALSVAPDRAPTPAAPGPTHGVRAVGDDLVRLDRDASARALAAALVCAGGGERPPRADRLAALQARLRAGEDFAAVLAGARLEAAGDGVLVGREPGELRRRAAAPTPLPPGRPTVWDGRWLLTAAEPGWSAVPAAGLRARLSPADRAALQALPAGFRGARPVLIRNDPPAAVLAGEGAKAQALVAERLARALDRMTHEGDRDAVFHGAPPRKHLFSGADIMNEGPFPRPEDPRRE